MYGKYNRRQAHRFRSARWATSVVFGLLLATTAHAGDWPQILGPMRNGKSSQERIAVKWPAQGPRLIWKHAIGQGYAGAAIVDNIVVVFHRVGNQERIEAISLESGTTKWTADFDALYRGGVDADLGPRCVPVIANQKVYAFGAAGDLHCVSLSSGQKIWTRELYQDFSGDEGYFGAGSTPIVIDARILVNVGGRKAGIVSLDAATGKTVWAKTNEQASYSAPTVFGDQAHQRVVFVTRLNAVLLDPEDGRITATVPFGKRGPTVNAATPLVESGNLFLTASYGSGAIWAKLTANSVSPEWSNDNTLSSQYNTPIFSGGYLYGIHGREDSAPAEMRCVEAKTGRVAWRQKNFGCCSFILADEKMIGLKNNGQLVLIEPNPKSYKQLAASKLPAPTTRALPALSNGRLIVRDSAGKRSTLYCLDLRK